MSNACGGVIVTISYEIIQVQFITINQINLQMFYHDHLLAESTQLSNELIAKFRRRNRNILKWDYSVDMLERWCDQLERIRSSQEITTFRNRIDQIVCQAQVIPKPNDSVCNIMSKCLSQMSLYIPEIHFKCKDNSFAAINNLISQAKEKETEMKKQTETEKEQSSQHPATDENTQENTQEETNETNDVATTETNTNETQEYRQQQQDLFINEFISKFKQTLSVSIEQFDTIIQNQPQEIDTDHELLKPICEYRMRQKNTQTLYCFGSWVESTSNNQTTDAISFAKLSTIQPIDCIDFNDKITMIISNRKILMCENKFQTNTLQPIVVDTPTISRNESTQEIEHEDQTQSEHEHNAGSNDLNKSASNVSISAEMTRENEITEVILFDTPFQGFHITHVFLTNHIANFLTNIGDVYCCFVESNQDESTNEFCFARSEIKMLAGHHITQLNGMPNKDICYGVSKNGSLFQWGNINSSDKPVLEKPIEMTDIDVSISKIDCTATACVALTLDKQVIIWGEHSSLYCESKPDEKPKKGSKNSKKDAKTQNNESEQLKKYQTVKIVKSNDSEENDDSPVTFADISCCFNSLFMMTVDQQIYTCGTDYFGALGLGKSNFQVLQPTQMKFNLTDNDAENADGDKNENDCSKMKQMFCSDHSCNALDENNNIWTWGRVCTIITPAQQSIYQELEEYSLSSQTETVENEDIQAKLSEFTCLYQPKMMKHNVPNLSPPQQGMNDANVNAVASSYGGFLWV